MDNDPLFADEENASGDKALNERPWKVLIADDDPSVHTITDLVLRSFTFQNRPIHCLHAYDSQECISLLERNSDVGVLLLDVVMEKDHSGLEIVRTVRERLGNTAIRIVLRTGQPGQAPEERVVAEYDINDYRLKTELTAQKLQSTLTSALRSYDSISHLERTNALLLGLVSGWSSVRAVPGLDDFMDGASTMLRSLTDLPGFQGTVFLLAKDREGVPELVNIWGAPVPPRYTATAHIDLPSAAEDLARKLGLVIGGSYVAEKKRKYLLCACFGQELLPKTAEFLDIFEIHFKLSLDSFFLRSQPAGSAVEFPTIFGDFVQTVSQEPGGHAQRVGVISQFLGRQLGMSSLQAELLRLAAQLHDIGNALLPRGLITKSSPLTPKERALMETHTTAGYDLLKHAERDMFKLAAVIARDHHERWNGTGYPSQLSGKDIGLEARIVAVADVFDALTRSQPYKEAMPEDQALAELRAEAGKGLDPELVALFLDNYSDIKELLEVYR